MNHERTKERTDAIKNWINDQYKNFWKKSDGRADSRTIESKPKYVHRIIKEKSKQMCTVCHNSQREGGNEREEEMPKSWVCRRQAVCMGTTLNVPSAITELATSVVLLWPWEFSTESHSLLLLSTLIQDFWFTPRCEILTCFSVRSDVNLTTPNKLANLTF